MKYILITGYSLLMQRNSGQLFIRNGGIRANIVRTIIMKTTKYLKTLRKNINFDNNRSQVQLTKFRKNNRLKSNLNDRLFYYYNQPKNNKITIFKIISSSLSFTPRAAQDTENWIMKIQNRTIM